MKYRTNDIIYLLSSYIGIFIIICTISIFLNIFFINNLSSILVNARKLNPVITVINRQCDMIENHINKKNNAIYEVQKKDLKTVTRNGKTLSLVGYNYNKGYKNLVKILEQDTSLKGINFD